MKHRRCLFSVKNPYDTQSDDAFINAAKENFLYHYEHCKDYRKIADGLGISAQTFHTIDDIPQLPCLPTLLFKRHHLKSASTLIRATSSGTSGNFSEIGFDIGGLLGALIMSCKIMHRRGLISLIPCHYIVMGYKPHRGNRTAVTKTAFGATLFAPAIRRRYILKYQNGAYSPDFEGIISALKKLDNSIFPVRFMGFPSYTFFLMKMLDERNIHIKLKKGSKIMLGGGWKQFYAEQVDKASFYQLAEKVFGVRDKDIVEFFGAVEHPILYCDCPNHHFHVPAYSRVVIRDADTLNPVPEGTAGLVNLITPMVSATPILSVMTDDLGVLHSGSQCGCGIQTPYLEIIGRVAPTEIKTCAAGAADILKTSQELQEVIK
ncbi:MAG: acyl-protein synthetase [Lachnospiraceae bacterium]|nr:acyl-protein synthetase [Lachnospiraceae bacterium]